MRRMLLGLVLMYLSPSATFAQQRAAQPKANLRLMVLPALRDLITAAGTPRP